MFPLLVVIGIYQYWAYVHFSGGLKQMESYIYIHIHYSVELSLLITKRSGL